MKKIELKVNIQCQKCKTEVLKAVTKLNGIDQVSVDAEKGMLTVIGNVDPVLVATRVRKKGKIGEIMSVGPLKPPEPPEKSPAQNPPPEKEEEKPLPPYCNECQLVAVYSFYDGGYCNIL